MSQTRSNVVATSGWDIPFWFAVLSPVLGIVVGFVAVLLFYH
jgi:hypothetical protein